MQDCAYRGATDPVGRAFVTDGKSPASGAGRRPLLITSVRDRPGAGTQDVARSSIECGSEVDLGVPRHKSASGKNLSQETPDYLRQPGPSRSRTAYAGMRNFSRRDAGGRTCLAHRLLQRLTSLRLTDAHNIARPRGRDGQQLRFIADRASGLSTAAVDAQIVGHELLLTQIIFNTDQSAVTCCRFAPPTSKDYEVSLAQIVCCSHN